jgi:xanthine dehydrogenase accessory factor
LLREFKLGSEDKAFVLVGVLRTEGPTAIKAGNKAIILSDGTVEGWIGGHCTEDEIVSTARDCLKDGTTRYLNLTTCQGGRMDVYLEPYLPKRSLVIFGHVPIVEALLRLAKTLNFNVIIVDKNSSKEKFPEADIVDTAIPEHSSHSSFFGKSVDNTFAVIATMGDFDAQHALTLCELGLPYIGIVAGKKRATELISFLKAKNISEQQISKIRSPAGIYIRAVTAEEIALSIMAEIVEFARASTTTELQTMYAFTVKEQRSSIGHSNSTSKADVATETRTDQTIYIDPVCGMTVDSSALFHSRSPEGAEVYFCCEECKLTYELNPQKYVLAS